MNIKQVDHTKQSNYWAITFEDDSGGTYLADAVPISKMSCGSTLWEYTISGPNGLYLGPFQTASYKIFKVKAFKQIQTII